MPDGVRLAARIWLPEDAGPVPAILEYIPYRKRDMVRARDERNHPYFAAHGYACLRVDMRGSGDSEGWMPDMYAPSELDDARQVLAWIAEQDWCNGRIGMFGTSWGGTASLQAAVDAPQPLKAVIANCATIDRFEDDIHWMGGCILTDTLEWGATLPAILAAPPDAATVGDEWFEIWKRRLAKLTFPHETWLRNNRRGTYWRHGSIRFAVDRLSCPILAIGGWSDRYSNSVMPLVEARPDICRGIVGPWGHHYPDHGEPGPAIGFQELALEWWDHFLGRSESKMPDWPVLRLWRRGFDPPRDRLAKRNGTWIEMAKPSVRNECRLHLGDGILTETPPEEHVVLDVPDDLRHGQCAGDTGYFGRTGGLPLDQTEDDRRALCFESCPFDREMNILGHVRLEADVTPDALPAQLACRLCDVAPDGKSNLITRTVINLELDDRLDGPCGAVEGMPTRVSLKFPTTAYRIPKGHRMRLALGSSYWPLIWPSAPRSRLAVSTEGAKLMIPLQPESVRPLKSAFPPVKDLPVDRKSKSRSEGPLERKPADGSAGGLGSSWRQPPVTLEFEGNGIEFTYGTQVSFDLCADDGQQTECSVAHNIEIRRPDGLACIKTSVSFSASEASAKSTAEITVEWNGVTVANKSSDTMIMP